MSSPIAVISLVLTPSLTKFSAIFLPTPPKETFIFPMLESLYLSSLHENPKISTFAPPITVTKFPSLIIYPFPEIYPF